MKCPTCQFDNPESAKFCIECGHKFGEELAIEGERKKITVLFSDLSGYTAMAERLDPEEVKNIISRIFGEIAQVVVKYDGSIEKFIGDAVVAFFGVPKAHEDDPVRALRAAREIHEIVNAMSHQFESKVGKPLSMHTGINTGLVVTGEVTTEKGPLGVTGDTLNVASRLSGLAEPGQTLVGEETYRQTRGYFAFEKLEPTKVKGKAELLSVYRMVEERVKVGRIGSLEIQGISSPLVGRDVEFVALTGCLNRLLDGQGGIVCIIGEAGIGKSRLMAEIRNYIRDTQAISSLQWLEGRTLSYGQKISYWPFQEIIWHDAGITEEDGEAEAWQKLENRISLLFAEEASEILPYLASLLGLDVRGEYAEGIKYLDGKSMGSQIYLTSRRFFERLAQVQPLVLVFEDLQWVDESSMLLLEHLLPLVLRVPILICGVSRTDPKIAIERIREIATRGYERRYTELPLSPLSQSDSLQMMRNLMEIDNLSSTLREMIVHKVDGNPFFLEEIMRSLIDTGAVAHDSVTGRWKTTERVEAFTIPDTIQGVIMARVDRLGEEIKHVIRTAAVIGRSFLYRVLKAIAEEVRELDRDLDQLQAVEMIRVKQKIPELEYIFKHALVQETTYGSILLQRRRELHSKVGQAIEVLFPDRLEEFYGLLAYHYARAENWEKAQDYLFKAGDQAGKIAADTEALVHYQEAIKTYTRVFGDKWDPIQRASLERKMGEAFFRRGEHDQAIEYLQRGLTLLGRSLPTSRLMILFAITREIVEQIIHRFLFKLFINPVSEVVTPAVQEEFRLCEFLAWIEGYGNYERFLLISLRMLNFSERKGLPYGIAAASMGLGVIASLISFFRFAEIYHKRAVTFAQKIENPEALGLAYAGLALHNNCLGRYEACIEYGLKSMKPYHEIGDIHGSGFATWLVAVALTYLGNFTHALAYAKNVVQLGREGADHHVLCWGLVTQGLIQRQLRQLDEAINALKEACTLIGRTNDYMFSIWVWTELGRVYLRKNQYSEGLNALETARKFYITHLTEPNVRICQVQFSDNISSQRSQKIGQLIYYWVRQRIMPLITKAWIWLPFRFGIVEAYLLAAEQSVKPEKGYWLKKAGTACQEALRQGKPYRGLMVEAMRMKGTYEWLKGGLSSAEKWWQRSLKRAEELGMSYELGMTHLEMGRRLKDRAHLQKAETIFAEIGAEWDLGQTRKLLRLYSALDSSVERRSEVV